MVGAIKNALPNTALSTNRTGSAKSTSVMFRIIVSIGAIRNIFIENALSLSQMTNHVLSGSVLPLDFWASHFYQTR